jgi:hypothetical protein
MEGMPLPEEEYYFPCNICDRILAAFSLSTPASIALPNRFIILNRNFLLSSLSSSNSFSYLLNGFLKQSRFLYVSNPFHSGKKGKRKNLYVVALQD